MWAVVEINKKQYKVSKGDVIPVDRLKVTGKIDFERVLLLCDGDNVEVGRPYLDGVSVKAEVLEEKKGEKKIVYKVKRRKKYRRKKGHRQIFTLLKIFSIVKKK